VATAVALKPEPLQLAERPHHGPFPIPFVTHVDEAGVPDFKVHDNAKRARCAEENLCQLCGRTLTGRMAFVGHTGSIERGTFGEPPMHEACCEYAWQVCPWLAGREWQLDLRKQAEGLTILPRPAEGLLGIWITDGYVVVPDDEGSGSVKWKPSPPLEAIDWRDREP
jgi:hypothetical protein